MSGFGVLYYTDCRPGQGLNGSAGFQFQAASRGLATEAMPLVQRGSLYEPPAAWMRERRPTADYPRSLTHTADEGMYATAAGCYLGQEANGSRQGNQFTHAIITRDIEDYGFLRPAQLWGASWWATAPAPGTDLDELPPAPEGGLLDTESIRDRVRQAPDGEERLTALLSAVERLADPEARQTVVLVSSDPELAACWIAAATLLLPQPRALRVGFKIFVADPQYGRHDIIALHPEWASRWADTSEGQGLVVFDLDRERHSRTDPTEAARFWVPRFLDADDPLDVVDAIELAGKIAQREAASGTERLAAVVVAAGEPLTAPEQLEQVSTWLIKARDEAAEVVREPLVEAVLAAGPKTDVLRNLALAIGTREWGAARATVRVGLLRAEIREALSAMDGAAAAARFSRLPGLPLYAHDADAAVEMESALRGTQRPDQVPALLVVANRHGLRPAVNRYRAEADRFAGWWVDQTGTPRTEGLLECLGDLPEPLDWVREVLRDRLRRHDPTPVRDRITAYWWRPLWQDAHDPADPLDVEVLQATYRQLNQRARGDLLRRVQGDALQSGLGDPGDAAWRMTFGPWPPSTTEACDFLQAWQDRGQRPSPQVCGRLAQVVESDVQVSDHTFWLIGELTRNGVHLSPRVEKMNAAENDIRNALNSMQTGKPGWPAKTIAGVFDNAPDALTAGRFGDLVDAMLRTPDGKKAVDVIRYLGRDRMARTLKALTGQPFWPTELDRVTADHGRAVGLAFRLVRDRDHFADDRQPILEWMANKLFPVIANTDRKNWKVLKEGIPRDLRGSWDDWSDEVRAGAVKRFFSRKGSNDGSGPASRKDRETGGDRAPAADEQAKTARASGRRRSNDG